MKKRSKKPMPDPVVVVELVSSVDKDVRVRVVQAPGEDGDLYAYVEQSTTSDAMGQPVWEEDLCDDAITTLGEEICRLHGKA